MKIHTAAFKYHSDRSEKGRLYSQLYFSVCFIFMEKKVHIFLIWLSWHQNELPPWVVRVKSLSWRGLRSWIHSWRIKLEGIHEPQQQWDETQWLICSLQLVKLWQDRQFSHFSAAELWCFFQTQYYWTTTGKKIIILLWKPDFYSYTTTAVVFIEKHFL